MSKLSIGIITVLTVACLVLTILLTAGRKESVTGDLRSESYVSAVMVQKSAEVAAQYKQAYELARIRLDEAITKNGGTGDGLYIVTDIDATLTDDSAYLAGVLMSKEEREQEGLEPWYGGGDWYGYYTALATESVQPVAGAQDFIAYARSKGVKVFFITNRPYYELDLTVCQLKKFGFIDDITFEAYQGLEDWQEYHSPEDRDALESFRDRVNSSSKFEISGGHFTLRDDYTIQVQGIDFSSDKAERRYNVVNQIGPEGKIVLYLGDSINDMVSDEEYRYTSLSETQSSSFAKENGNDARTRAVTDNFWEDQWGTEFIVMPNTWYGDWQQAVWYNKDITDSEKIEAIREEFERYSYRNSEIWYSGPSPIGNKIQ